MNAIANAFLNSITALRSLRPAETSVNSIRPMPGALVAVEGQAPQPSRRRDAPGPENPPGGTPLGTSPVPALLSRHAATIALAAIPLVVFGAAAVSRPTAPLPVIPVQVEGVRVIRMDATSFSGRWRPIYDMPPATVIHQQKGDDALTQETGKPLATPARPPPAAVRNVKRASLHLTNICTRHGMRKVETVRGNWKGWRCRK